MDGFVITTYGMCLNSKGIWQKKKPEKSFVFSAEETEEIKRKAKLKIFPTDSDGYSLPPIYVIPATWHKRKKVRLTGKPIRIN